MFNNPLVELMNAIQNMTAQHRLSPLNSQLEVLLENNSYNGQYLAAVVAGDYYPKKFKQEALKRLQNITDQTAINGVCSIWYNTRYPELTELLRQKGWVATAPTKLRVLTMLLTDQIYHFERGDIKALLEALLDADPDIRERAESILRHAQGSQLDALAGIWARGRHPLLQEILISKTYLPERGEGRVLMALYLEKWDILQQGKAIVYSLVKAIRDYDPLIRERAGLALRKLKRPDSQATLCNLVVEQDIPLAQAAALEMGFLPADNNFKALFYFVTEQWDKYEGLDFDHRILRAAYEAGTPEFRRRVAGKVRAAGRVAYLSAISGGESLVRNSAINGEEAELLVQILAANREWAKLWGLVSEIPLAWSVAAMKYLLRAGWQPDKAEALEMFSQLKPLTEQITVDEELLAGQWLPPAILRAIARVPGRVNDVAFSPTSPVIAIATGKGKVVLWNIQEGKREQLLEGFQHSIGKLAYSPANILLIAERTGTEDDPCTVYGWQANQLFRLGQHSGSVTGLVTVGTTQVVSAGRDSEVKLWDLGSRTLLGSRSESRYDSWARGLAVSPDGQQLAVLNKGITYLSLPALQPNGMIPPRNLGISKYATYSPDGKMLVAANASAGMTVCMTSQARKSDLPGTVGDEEARLSAVQGLASLPGSPVVLWGKPNGKIEFWDWAGGKSLGKLKAPGERLTSLKISPDGAFMAVGNADTSFTLWDLRILQLRDLLKNSLSQAKIVHMTALAAALADNSLELNPSKKAALHFMEIILRQRFRYDVELVEAPAIMAGEFDIEF